MKSAVKTNFFVVKMPTIQLAKVNFFVPGI